MTKLQTVLKQARQVAAASPTWADLSNSLFDPTSGVVAKAFPTERERRAFLKTPEYAAIRKLLNDAIESSGLVDGASPRKSGRFVVRVPKSLHASLEREADAEGVSLNQLVVTKLALRLEKLTTARRG